MAKQRKSWDQLSIDIDEERNMVQVETLLKFFEVMRDGIRFDRPFLGTANEIKQAVKVSPSNSGAFPTEQGVALIGYLFSLPFVEQFCFTFSGRFTVKIYPQFNIADETVAEIVETQIKKCVEKTAGKPLTIVDDLTAENLYEEITVPA